MTSNRIEVDPPYQAPAFRAVLRSGAAPPSRGIQVYGVIRGRPSKTLVVEPRGDAPHYHVLVTAEDGMQFDVAVDIYDKLNGGAQVRFLVLVNFNPPDPDAWLALPSGATTIGAAGSGGLGIDYFRQHLVTSDQFSLLPVDPKTIGKTLGGPVADLAERAVADPSADFFAFGQLFAAGSTGANPVFGFKPDAGIHDIHLNQGEPGRNQPPFEDGALIVHFPSDGHWEAAFFAFQDQSFELAP